MAGWSTFVLRKWTPSLNLDLNLAIGKVGTVQLNGGTIVVGNVNPNNSLEAKRDRIRVLNDGVITGSGRIETGMFDNRYLGRVTVNAGQTLTIAPSAAPFSGEQAATTPPTNPTPPDGPVANYGLLEIIGTSQTRAELNFERAPDPPGTAAVNRTWLVNKPAFPAPYPTGFDGGVISASMGYDS